MKKLGEIWSGLGNPCSIRLEVFLGNRRRSERKNPLTFKTKLDFTVHSVSKKWKTQNSAMISIDLSCNEIEHEFAIAITNLLQVNSTLILIILSDNPIKTSGTIAIVNALKVNITLTFIVLEQAVWLQLPEHWKSILHLYQSQLQWLKLN